jgi:hypothetical protein
MVEPTRHGPGWRWMADATIPSFILQLLISTLGAMLTGVAVVVFLALIVRIASGGYSVDAVQRHIFVLADEPYFIAPILAGFFLGRLGGRFFRSAATVLLWIVPAAVLLVSMASEPGMDVWHNYFGSRCGASECAGELFFTAPFYTSVAYTAGWVSKNLHLKNRAS